MGDSRESFATSPTTRPLRDPRTGTFSSLTPLPRTEALTGSKSRATTRWARASRPPLCIWEKMAPTKPNGVLGFCFGSWLLSKVSAEGDVDFDCAVGCHPTTVLEQ